MGRTPHSGDTSPRAILCRMKIIQKNVLTFGDLIAAAYQVWGAGRAATMVRLAIKARQVVFRKQPHSLISFAKGRFV